MPIVVDYQADPTLQALASARGSAAPVAAEQDWRERQLAEQQYQFDQEYDWRIQQAALQDRMARYESGNRTAIAGAQIQSNNYNNQLDYDLGQQSLDQRSEQFGVEAALQADQQQQLTNRAQMAQLGQIARQQQQQRFDAAMADRKAAEDWMRTASPRQQQQFRQQWEQKHGLGWTAPEEAMAQQDAEYQQQRVAGLHRLFADPFNPGQSLLDEGSVEFALQLTPKEQFEIALREKSEARQRAALQQKEGEADRKLEEEDAKAQQKQQIEAAKEATKTMRDSIAGERAWRQAQEEHARDVAQYEADMKAYESAKSAHSKISSRGGGAGGAAPKPFTQTPPMKPVPPTPGLFADKIPTPQSPEEVSSYLPGTRFLAPDGTIRVR